MSKRKPIQKLIAMMLSVIMVVGMTPVSALAESGTLPVGASGEIIVFGALDADIVAQSVPLGTSESKLKLPDTLTATLALAALEEEPVLDSGEADTKPDSADAVSGSAIDVEETEEAEIGDSEGDEIASPSDTEITKDSFETEPTEKTVDSAKEITVPMPVTWNSSPEYDGEAAGTYIFTPDLPEGLTLASGVEVPAITVTVGAVAIIGTVTAFDELCDNVRWQNTSAPEFPETVSGTVEDETADIPVTWEADHDYDAESPDKGLYVFTAVLGDGYRAADDVEYPRITVYIPQSAGRMMARMADSPLEITTAAQLAEIATLVNARENGLELFLFNNAGARVSLKLMNDIDLSAYTKGEGWVPIGTETTQFKGSFDGGGKTITNLTIDRTDSEDQGLFGVIGAGGTVKNLGVVNTEIEGGDYVGGVAGTVYGGASVQYCYSTGSVSGIDSVGGVAGYVKGSVENCYSTGSVSGIGSVGGVVGSAVGGSTVENCYSTGAVSGTGDFVSGVAGTVYGIVKNCAALNPSVSGTGGLGRVAGYVDGGPLSGNIAFSGMKVTKNGSAKSLVEGTDQEDGEPKTAAAISAAGFFEALFGNDTAWTYEKGKLPGFGAAVDMPLHLLDDTSPFSGGDGLSSDTAYQITTPTQLAKLAELVNAGNASYNAAHYKLMNDLDLSAYGKDYDDGKGWTSIGNTYTQPFKGVFDGNGKTITELYINQSGQSHVGLFGSISRGTAKNLALQNVSIKGRQSVGGVTGSVYEGGMVQGCFVSGIMSGADYIGGVVGFVYGSTAQNCYSAVSLTSTSSNGSGGVIGRINFGTVKNCYSIGSVDGVDDNGGIGGVVGVVYSSTLQNCAALNPSVSGTSSSVHRVAKLFDGSTLSGNIAFIGMTVNGSTVSDGTLTDHNGAPKTAEDINAASFWTTASGFTADWNTTVWEIAPGKLPILKGIAGQNASMPEHLLPAGASVFEGAGTSEGDPYLIKTAADLAKLAQLVNEGTSPYADPGRYYRLEKDLDLSSYASGEGWMPIGASAKQFKGIFDGNNKTITGLTINRPAADNIGLFGYLYIDSKVQNIRIIDASVIGKARVGGVAGYAWGATVENCAVVGSISGADNVGGTVGRISSGTVQNCYSTGSVTGSGDYVGGIMGYLEHNATTVRRCYSGSSVSGRFNVGGIVGEVGVATVQDCYSTGNIKGVLYVGGVAGEVSSGSVQNCYSTGSVLGTDSEGYIGGVAGVLSSGTVKNCVALNPSINAGAYNFGRVVGKNTSGSLLNNYAFSRIPGTWANKGLSAKDGADMTSQTLFGGDFWANPTYWADAAWDGDIWQFTENKLPTLKGVGGPQHGDGGLYLTARDIQYATVGATDGLTYNGSKQIPTLTVTFDGETLTKNTDYTVAVADESASDGTNAGTVTLTITGIGSFYGTRNITYTIAKKTITIMPYPGQSKKHGEIDPILTFANGAGLTPGAFTGKLSRAAGENVGTYAISLGNLSAGGNYELSLAPVTVNFTIEQAKVSEITTTVDNANKTAYEMRTATTAQAVVDAAGLPSSVNVSTDGGTAVLPITWSTVSAYNAKTAIYVVVGTLTGNSNIEPNGVTASLTVTVTPVTAVTPTFSDTLVVISSDSSATAAELGSAILPASGSIMVEGQSVAYTVDWNGGEALDRTAVGTEQTFTGTISYITPPAWLTLPDSSTVSRKVSVTAKQAVIIGGITTANKAYDGASYAPSGTATVTGGSVPVNQLEWLYESTDSAGYRNSTAPTNAGAYKLTISVPESNPDYAGSEIFNFTIAKREITLVTDNKTVTKGGSLPELTYTVGNLAPGETKADALSTQPVLACPTFDGNTVGSYPITLTGGTATGNYTITTRTNGTLTVAEQTYTVTFNLNGGSRTGGGELSQTIAEGGAATAPTVYRSGYTLTGWDKSFDNVTADLTVTASWSYNGGGGGGSSSDSSPIIITPPAADKPNSPTQGEIKVPGTVDKKGNITVNITDKTVTDAFNKALAEAKKNGTEQNGITVVLRVDTGNNTDSNVTVNLPKAVQDTIIAKKIVSIIIVVDNPDIRVGIDLAAVQEINKQAKSDVNITATRMDSGKLIGDAKKAIGNRPVFDLKVNYGNGKAVSSFGAGSVSVTIPYTLGANEKAGNVQAVYVDSKGKVHWLVNSVYDSVEQVLRFSTNHFSTYGIGYKQTNTAFKDIAGHWAKGDIEFVASRGLFSGTSETKFSPNTAMTRGMFVTALGRLANADVSGYAKSSFSDVKGDAYYMGYIEWASKNSIVSGIGNGKFAPDQSITREQMAVIMSNYAKAIGYTLPKVHVENTFADNSKISTYAKEAVKQMQMAGVISGKNGNLFDPQGTATRAEVSAVLRRFVELAISSDTAQGWTMNDSGKWMYFKDGKPLTGKQDIDGATYTFDQYGVTADVPKNLRYTTYTVQKGDSFWSISRKLNCTMAELERLNNKSRFALIHPGDVLRVPEK
ncbi:S-layer homology domain-containing protein [Anoxybacterium hadale]|uniref:S-layer homology domain-containing protein n=1 Tax=Anoxybacterium hadale TaxID=3408580 RepID=UPI003AFF9BFD